LKAVRLPEVVFAETDELSRGLLWVGAAEKESDTSSNIKLRMRVCPNLILPVTATSVIIQITFKRVLSDKLAN